MIITFDEFENKYKPQINKIARAQYDSDIADSDVAPFCGWMYETYGEEVAVVDEAYDQNPNTVWTIVEGDDGEFIITSGYAYVNRCGYIITSVPFEGEKFDINVID